VEEFKKRERQLLAAGWLRDKDVFVMPDNLDSQIITTSSGHYVPGQCFERLGRSMTRSAESVIGVLASGSMEEVSGDDLYADLEKDHVTCEEQSVRNAALEAEAKAASDAKDLVKAKKIIEALKDQVCILILWRRNGCHMILTIRLTKVLYFAEPQVSKQVYIAGKESFLHL
jgi:hypothetical protein